MSGLFLTDKGRQCVNMLEQKFDRVEAVALTGFSDEEIRHLQMLLCRVYDNMMDNEKDNRKRDKKI